MNTKKLKIMYNNFEHYSEIILVHKHQDLLILLKSM